MGDSDTYYNVLDVDPSADDAEIKAAYRRMVQRVHPDQGGSHALFRQVQVAYETLSDPERRAAYDELLQRGNQKSPPSPPGRSGGTTNPPPPPPGSWSGHQYPPPPASAETTAQIEGGSFFSTHPATTVALAGVLLLILGSAGQTASLFLLGLVVIVIAGVAGLGRRRAAERENYRRAGISAVDSMSGIEFEELLLHLFGSKGFKVTHVGGRGDFGADLLLDGPRGRIVVQAKRWAKPVTHDAVQQVVAAKAQYGASAAIAVASSSFTAHARELARTNEVELWERARLAQELTALSGQPIRSGAGRFGSELSAGIPILFSSLFAIVVALGPSKPKSRRPARKSTSLRWSNGRRVRVRRYTRQRRRR